MWIPNQCYEGSHGLRGINTVYMHKLKYRGNLESPVILMCMSEETRVPEKKKPKDRVKRPFHTSSTKFRVTLR